MTEGQVPVDPSLQNLVLGRTPANEGLHLAAPLSRARQVKPSALARSSQRRCNRLSDVGPARTKLEERLDQQVC